MAIITPLRRRRFDRLAIGLSLGWWLFEATLWQPGFVAAKEVNTQRVETELVQPLDAAGLRAELERIEAAADKVVLVNFWATWCRPCLDEIPVFMQLEQQYREQGFRLLAVSLDDAATINTDVRPFVAKWFPGFRSYVSVENDMDDMVSVIDGGWNEVLPTSYLIARDGSLAERLQGVYTREQLATRIVALLGAPPPNAYPAEQ